MNHRSYRLLILAPFAPRLDAAMGGSRVIAQLLLHITTRHEVALLYLRGPGEPPLDLLLEQRCALSHEVVRPPLDPRPHPRFSRRIWAGLLAGQPAWVTEWAVPTFRTRLRDLLQNWRPEIVQFEFHIMGQYVDALKENSACRILTQHEPGTQAARDRLRVAGASGRWMRRLDALAWAKYEAALLARMEAVVVFTERDRIATRQVAPSSNVVTIPLGAELPAAALSPVGAGPPNLYFCGNFIHGPNVKAAIRLARDIFPPLQAGFPDLKVTLVGPHAPPALSALESDTVELTGYVPAVEPYLDSAAVVVLPIDAGGGMRVKALEALAAGKAVVASRLAVEGLQLTDGEHVLLAESDEDFRAGIARLLEYPDLRRRVGAAARSWAVRNLSWDRSVAAYERLYASVLPECRLEVAAEGGGPE